MLGSVRETNEQIDRWFRARPVLRWLALAVVPGAVYAGFSVLIGGDSLVWGMTLGIVSGATFATVFTGLERLRQ